MTPETAVVLRRALLMIVRHIEKNPAQPLPTWLLYRAVRLFTVFVSRHPHPDTVAVDLAYHLEGFAKDLRK